MKNEKGLTLVELLAATTILLIISSLVYSVLIGANKNYNDISNKSRLQQEANIIITTIKNKHHQTDSYYLTYDKQTDTTKIDGNPLGSNIAEFDVTGEGVKKVETLGTTDNYTIDSTKFISINFKLNKQGDSIKINTVIKRY